MKPKRCKIPGPFVVYMLHFHHPVEPSHYIGITTPARLDARMREHAAGRGSLPTARMCVLDVSWALAGTWHTEDRKLEKKMRGLRPLSGVCPVCRGKPAIKEYRPTKTAALGEDSRQFEGFNLTTTVSKTATSKPMKKGTQRRPRPPFPYSGQT